MALRNGQLDIRFFSFLNRWLRLLLETLSELAFSGTFTLHPRMLVQRSNLNHTIMLRRRGFISLLVVFYGCFKSAWSQNNYTVSVGDGEFILIDEAVTDQSQAKAACGARNMFLGAITSDREHLTVLNLAKNLVGTVNTIWLGNFIHYLASTVSSPRP